MKWLQLEADVLNKSTKSTIDCISRSTVQEGSIQPNTVLYNSAISVAEKAGACMPLHA